MSDTTLPRQGFLKSIYARCLLIVATTAAILVTIVGYMNYREKLSASFDIVSTMSLSNMHSSASSLAAPLLRSDTASVENEMSRLLFDVGGLADGAVVLLESGDLFYESSAISATDKSTLTDLASRALRTGSVVKDYAAIDIGAPIFDEGGMVVGALAIDWSTAGLTARIQNEALTVLAAAGLLLSVALAANAYFLNRILGRPLNNLAKSVQRVSKGDYSTAIEGVDRGDEVGMIAGHLDVMRVGLEQARAQTEEAALKQREQKTVISALRTSLKSLSSGNLRTELKGDFAPDYAGLVDDYNSATSSFRNAMSEVVTLADQIRDASTEIGSHSDALSRRSENQAATLEETAAALDDLTTGVKAAADGSREVEGIVKTARTETAQSGVVVRQTVEAMTGIKKSSSQISDIIVVIDDIAFQTNLLALNAGVEAARAGDAGRGFAVVASEVRALAQRTTEAAKEITALIEESSVEVANGVKLVDETGSALTSITERVVQIASLTSEIADSAEDQSSKLYEINAGVANLDQVTQRNAGMAEEANAASQNLLDQANALSALVAKFEIGSQNSKARDHGLAA